MEYDNFSPCREVAATITQDIVERVVIEQRLNPTYTNFERVIGGDYFTVVESNLKVYGLEVEIIRFEQNGDVHILVKW